MNEPAITNDSGGYDLEKLLANPPPAIILFAHKAFELFCLHSNFEDVKIPLTDEVIKARVFRGKIGDIFNSTGASRAYYSKIRQLLIDFNSIVILHAGTAHSASVVVVRPENPPPIELPGGMQDPNVKSRELLLTLIARTDTLEARLEKLEAGRGDINIVDAFRNHETRLSRLEGNSQAAGISGKDETGESPGTK